MGRDEAESTNKLSSSMVGSETKNGDTVKRRPRGNVYGKYLWGANPMDSGELDYVRKHGEEVISKALDEDTHWKYVSLKQVQDVRLYTPLAAPEDDSNNAAAVAPSSDPSRSLSSTSSSSTKERTSATPRMLPGRCDFRAMTRVPGSIDTIMEILAADDDREAYWTAINTQKGLRACRMFGSRRLDAVDPFPRWSQKYMATRFTKYSTKSVDFCFAEYSKYAPVTKEGGLKRGFIYRRSVDESLFSMDEIKARLAKYDDDCERMYIQDWLYEISETQERDVCKVVLTCSVYFSGDYSRSLRSEFHEFTTDILIQLRKVLSKQWKEQHSDDATVEKSVTASSILNNAFGKLKPGQSRYCAVCSTTFTLLRKRYTCKTCNVSMCSKCAKTSSRKSILQETTDSNGITSRSSSTSNKECILCYQFNDDVTTESRSSVSIRRHFKTPMSSSTNSVSASEYSEDDSHSDTSTSSRSIVGEPEPVRLFDPATDVKQPPKRVVRRVRGGSSDSATSSKSVPGVVLFSDLDSLTLSASARGGVKSSASSSATSRVKRPIRATSEDNVLIKEEVSESDDLANFNLKLL